MNHVRIKGRRFAYSDEGEGPALLLGHSYLWDHRMWREQVARLRDSYRCIAPDLWGHGESDPPPKTPYTLDELAEDHFCLMQKLGIENFSILGLSIGGMWAPRLALRHPNAVTGLILMDTDAGTEPEASHRRFSEMFAVIEQVGAIPPAIVEAVVPGFFSARSHRERPELVNEFRAALAATPRSVVPGLVVMGRAFVNRNSLLEKLNSLTVPTLVMIGADDVYRPLAEAQRLTAHIPGAELEIIPGAGHISALEQADEVTARIVNFLQTGGPGKSWSSQPDY